MFHEYHDGAQTMMVLYLHLHAPQLFSVRRASKPALISVCAISTEQVGHCHLPNEAEDLICCNTCLVILTIKA